MEEFWKELGVVKGLWRLSAVYWRRFQSDPFPRGEKQIGEASRPTRRFSQVIDDDLELKDLPLWGWGCITPREGVTEKPNLISS